MKFFKIITVFFLMMFFQAHALHQLYADKDGVKIPYGTSLELSMANNITTRNIIEGDIFQAYLTKDIYVNNKLILPSKTIFRGRVSKVTYSKNLSRPAVLYLTLDHLVTKTGEQLGLSAGIASDFNYILTTDGALTVNGGYFKAVARDAKKSAKLVSNSINWGKNTSETLFDGAKYIFVPIGAIGGGIGCVGVFAYNTVADLFRHGDEIVIKQGSIFNIVLLSTLEVPN